MGVVSSLCAWSVVEWCPLTSLLIFLYSALCGCFCRPCSIFTRQRTLASPFFRSAPSCIDRRKPRNSASSASAEESATLSREVGEGEEEWREEGGGEETSEG